MKNVYMKDDTERLYNEAKRVILTKDNTIVKLTEDDAIKYILKYFLDRERIK